MSGASGTWTDDPGILDSVTGAAYRIGNAIYDAAGNLIDWVEDTATDATGAVQAQLAQMRDAGAQFMVAYQQFSAIGPEVLNTPYANEWLSIKARADAARATLDAIASGAQSTYGWAKSVFGLSGVRAGVQQLDGLGILPVLSVAFIAGAVVLVVGLANEMTQFVGNYNLVKQGKQPIVGPGGVIGQTTSAVKWIIGGGVALLLLPHVLDAFKDGKR